MGYRTLDKAAEEDRLTAFHTISDVIGAAWRRYKVWDEIEPEELIVGGNYDGTPLWKRNGAGLHRHRLGSLRAMRNRHDCPASSSAKRTSRCFAGCTAQASCTPSTWRRRRSGKRRSSTWRRSRRASSTDELVDNYLEAHDHYDFVVGPRFIR